MCKCLLLDSFSRSFVQLLRPQVLQSTMTLTEILMLAFFTNTIHQSCESMSSITGMLYNLDLACYSIMYCKLFSKYIYFYLLNKSIHSSTPYIKYLIYAGHCRGSREKKKTTKALAKFTAFMVFIF